MTDKEEAPAPERIWMAADTPFELLTTWEKKINDSDIEYVRADIASPTAETLDGHTLNEWKDAFWGIAAQRDQWIAWGWAMLEQGGVKHFRPNQDGQRALLSGLIRREASLDLESRLIKLAAALVQGRDFISDIPEDHPKSVPRYIVKTAAKQREQLRKWAIEAREIADAQRDRRSAASRTQDGLTKGLERLAIWLEEMRACEGDMCTHCIDLLAENVQPLVESLRKWNKESQPS